jgi:hypothetical protein
VAFWQCHVEREKRLFLKSFRASSATWFFSIARIKQNLERYDGIRLTAQQCWWTVTLTQRDGDARAFVQRARRGERVSSSATYASVDVLVELMCDIP